MTAQTGGNGRKQRLELTWIGKDDRPRLEPRILLPVAEESYSKGSMGDGGIQDNILIQGDNLLALKSLEQEFSGKVKCAFIDPPYNTGSAFQQYDDGLEHSLWLSLIRDRIEILRRLLSADGSLWITIDDNEAHYLKVLCDEVFGRSNFVANVIWQKVYSERMDARGFSASHDHILVYRKTERFLLRPLRKEQNTSQFRCFDEKKQKYYRRRSLRKEGSESLRQNRPSMWYGIRAPDDTEIWPIKPDGTEGRWRWKKENVKKNEDQLEFINRDGRWEIYVKQYLEDSPTRPPSTIWLSEDVGHNHEAKLEIRAFNKNDVFDTPKPERLIQRIFEIASEPHDLVLDSFAGSGTTGAVAHKMGRRWIMVELGDHAHTHIVPRLRKVADGEDQGGITQAVEWKGGGGFRFYRLAPSLIETDKFGQKIISKHYNAEMLAEAMCKHMGFTYAPSQDPQCYWQHGHSTERDFIYVTTQALTHDGLRSLSLAVGEDRSLLVCCKAFRARLADFPNLTVKKIPQAVLDKCEWGRDDYSLNISAQPEGASSGSDDDPEDGDGSGGESASTPLARPDGDTQPNIEASERRAKKAPLKMDGTTRTRKPKASRVEPTVVATNAPSEAKKSKASRSSKKTTKAAKAPKKAAAKKAAKKPKSEVGRSAAKSRKGPKATAKPSRTRKSRNTVEQAQGRLL